MMALWDARLCLGCSSPVDRNSPRVEDLKLWLRRRSRGLIDTDSLASRSSADTHTAVAGHIKSCGGRAKGQEEEIIIVVEVEAVAVVVVVVMVVVMWC